MWSLGSSSPVCSNRNSESWEQLAALVAGGGWWVIMAFSLRGVVRCDERFVGWMHQTTSRVAKFDKNISQIVLGWFICIIGLLLFLWGKTNKRFGVNGLFGDIVFNKNSSTRLGYEVETAPFKATTPPFLWGCCWWIVKHPPLGKTTKLPFLKLRKKPWKSMVGSDEISEIGAERPTFFRNLKAVSFGECSIWDETTGDPGPWWVTSPAVASSLPFGTSLVLTASTNFGKKDDWFAKRKNEHLEVSKKQRLDRTPP